MTFTFELLAIIWLAGYAVIWIIGMGFNKTSELNTLFITWCLGGPVLAFLAAIYFLPRFQ